MRRAGQRIIPGPRQRADLRPFIDAFHIATGVAAPVGNYQSKPSFNKIDNASLGDAGLVMLDADIQDKGFPEDRLNTIALIRGPRMVVHYHHVGGSSPYVAVVFVSLPAILRFGQRLANLLLTTFGMQVPLILKNMEKPRRKRLRPSIRVRRIRPLASESRLCLHRQNPGRRSTKSV